MCVIAEDRRRCAWGYNAYPILPIVVVIVNALMYYAPRAMLEKSPECNHPFADVMQRNVSESSWCG